MEKIVDAMRLAVYCEGMNKLLRFTVGGLLFIVGVVVFSVIWSVETLVAKIR